MSKKTLIGLDKFYYALLVSDTSASVSYDTPVALKGAMTVSYNPNSEVATIFADDGPYDTAETIGELELDVGIADISQEDYAALMGHTITGGVMAETATDQPVDTAFGFRAKRSNGGYSYYWFLKGKFSKPSMEHETKGGSISWQTPTLNGKFVARVYDGKYKYSTRDDADDYTAGTGTGWFTAVYDPTADTTAPLFSSAVPSASMTSATQTTNLTITFSEAVLASTVTAANFTIVQATGAITIPITAISQSVGGETITLTQSAMTASTTYNVVIGIGVKDTRGIAMTAAHTYKFTTSA
jgi:phi13 family phage major tail protein